MSRPIHPGQTTCAGVNHCRRSFVVACVPAVLWAVAVFTLQEYTTASNYPLSLVSAVGSRIIRAALDVLACGTFVFLLRGWPLYLTIVLNACGVLVLTVYYEYFARALSFTTIRDHFLEGRAVVGFASDLIRWQSFSLIVLTVLILLTAARWADRHRLPRRRRAKLGAMCAVAYAVLACVSTLGIGKISKLQTFGTVDRIAMTNGYLLTWYGEWLYLDADALLRKAKLAATITSDRLTPIENPLSLPEKVAVIQVESLEDPVVDFEVAHQPVMPFLHELSARSMRFRITPVHASGSCDADFVMLMNLHPIGDVTPYRVSGFDFSPSLAAHARKNGYRSVFLHGNHGSFFHRQDGVREMRFDTVLFREELESRYGLRSGQWGVSDEDVLAVSSRFLNQDDLPALHFIITLTSHGPYHFLRPQECELFPSPKNMREHYMNSMRYVDNQLKTYVESLPDGTVVILYGDHASHVDYGQGLDPGSREFVPFLIAQVGADLAPLQRTGGLKIATGGELTTLDAAGYVWSLFRAAR